MIKEWKYWYNQYIIKKNPNKYVLIDGKDEYKIHKLDHNNLEYIEYNNNIYYIIWFNYNFFIYKWTKDFTLERILKDWYRWLDVTLIHKLLIENFWKYFDNNILLHTPVSEYIKLNTYGFYIYIRDLNRPWQEVFNDNFFCLEISIMNIQNTNIWISPKDFYENSIRNFVLSNEFINKIKLKNIYLGYAHYIEHLNCYQLSFVIELWNMNESIFNIVTNFLWKYIT
jgi:hypothetical protein